MKKILKWAVLGLMALVWSLHAANAQPDSIDAKIRRVLVCRDIPPFTIKLIISQARFESGNYTNGLFTQHCNLFGMRHPKQRPTYSKGPYAHAEGKHGYASYSSIEDSVMDQLLYLSYIGATPAFKTTTQYVRILKKNYYFGSSEAGYVKGLQRYNQLQMN